MLERSLGMVFGDPRRMAGRSLILAYHNVVPDQMRGLGDQPLHLSQSSFIQQIDFLEETCSVCSIAEILRGQSALEKPRVAITFDDAYQGAVGFALPELIRRRLPASVFVAPGLLGSLGFWWDQLADDTGTLSPELRNLALDLHAGRQDRVKGMRPTSSGTLPEAVFGCATEGQLRSLSGATVTFGLHSWSHPNLTRVEEPDLQTELLRPLEWFQTADLPVVPVLAYPYGLSSPKVERLVQQAGYSAALLVEGGWMDRTDQYPWRVPRFNVPAGISIDGFRLRLAGCFTS